MMRQKAFLFIRTRTSESIEWNRASFSFAVILRLANESAEAPGLLHIDCVGGSTRLDMKERFDTLINRLSPTIRRISHRLNGHFTFFNDDDLCQEAMMHLWVAFQEGKLTGKNDSYILQGCYYHLKNHIRTTMDRAKLTSMDRPVDEEGTMLKDLIADPNGTRFENIEGSIISEEVIKNGLSDREITALGYLLDGFTTREIGQKMGVSHVSVIKIKNKIKDKCSYLQREIRDSYQN